MEILLYCLFIFFGFGLILNISEWMNKTTASLAPDLPEIKEAHQEEIECPYCFEKIIKGAKKCKHCEGILEE